MATCERCRGSLVEVPTTIGNQQLLMRRCSTCDTTEWRRGDTVIDLREVLDLTAEANPSSRRGRQVDERQPAGSSSDDADLGL